MQPAYRGALMAIAGIVIIVLAIVMSMTMRHELRRGYDVLGGCGSSPHDDSGFAM